MIRQKSSNDPIFIIKKDTYTKEDMDAIFSEGALECDEGSNIVSVSPELAGLIVYYYEQQTGKKVESTDKNTVKAIVEVYINDILKGAVERIKKEEADSE